MQTRVVVTVECIKGEKSHGYTISCKTGINDQLMNAVAALLISKPEGTALEQPLIERILEVA